MYRFTRPVVVALVLAMVAGFGCAKKTTDSGQSAEDMARLEADKKKQAELEALRQKELEEARKRAMMGKMSEADAKTLAESVYFDFDSSALRPASVTTLQAKVDTLKKCDVKVVIEGNCDPRGTEAYNMALGERRAKAAYNFLTKAGIASSRLSTVSYGESKATGKNDAGWKMDRRDDFRASN